jgi:LysM repeat protein
MNTPNPLVPQGSLPQGAPGKFNIRLVVFGIVAVHAVFFCGLLIQGCKPKDDAAKPKAQETVSLPPLPTPAEPTPSTPAPSASLPPTGATSAPIATAPPAIAPAPTIPTTPAPVAPPPVATTPFVPTTPTPTEMVPTSTGTHEHVVAKGDSFSTIGKKYHVTAAAIAKANPQADSSKLKIGQKLQIPEGAAAPATASAGGTSMSGSSESTATYVVKSGDNLTTIAKKNGTTPKAIRTINGLKSDRIKVGEKLKLPSKGGAPAGGTPPSIEPVPTAPPVSAPGTAIPATTPGANP